MSRRAFTRDDLQAALEAGDVKSALQALIVRAKSLEEYLVIDEDFDVRWLMVEDESGHLYQVLAERGDSIFHVVDEEGYISTYSGNRLFPLPDLSRHNPFAPGTEEPAPRELKALEDFRNAKTGTVAKRHAGNPAVKVDQQWYFAGSVRPQTDLNMSMITDPMIILWEPQ